MSRSSRRRPRSDWRSQRCLQRAFLVGQAIGLELAADLRIIGRADTPGTRRLQEWADRRDLRTDLVDLDASGGADLLLAQLGLSEADLPVVVIPRTGARLSDPDDGSLDRALQSTD